MRLLVITHTFPPGLHSNAKRPSYVVQGALAAGWKVDVITSNIGLLPGTEETLKHPNLTIDRVADPVIKALQKTQKTPLLGPLLMKAVNGISWPDYCANWMREVLRKKDDFSSYDRVLAFVFPPSILKAGLEHGLVGGRWIFDYQESVSPQFEKFPRGSALQRLRTPRLRRLEKETLQKAGKVIFTAKANRQAYIDGDLVDTEKTEHVPYFYDEEAFQVPGEVGPLFEIGYYGNFDLSGSRNPKTFLHSLAGFLEKHPEAREKTLFKFHGSWLETHDQLIVSLNLRDVCQILKAVSYQEYLEKLKQSPILLLVVAEAHNLFMPSKIVDYFGARRPILAFVPPKSEMHEVLVEAGMENFLCGDSEVEEGIRALEKLWECYQNDSLEVDSSKTSKWASSSQISRHLNIIQSACDDGS